MRGKFMNGGFRWTVLITLAVGAWLAGTVATLQLREMSDRRIAAGAVAQALVVHDSLVAGVVDSLMAHDAQIMATLDILRDRSYRLNDGLTDLERTKKEQRAHKEIERDERRNWP